MIAIVLALALVPEPRELTAGDGFLDLGTNVVSRQTVAAFVDDFTLPKEGYRLTVTPERVTVASADAAGAFYAVKTLEQLAERKDGKTVLPAVTITDSPAYGWRGMMLDECRHFFGKETVKRLLDLMADYKYNLLHWHLTEDQGWRLAIDRYPKLVEYGAARPSSPVRGGDVTSSDGKTYGPHFYTKEDVREILAYAKARHVTVMPEIELPGHARAALAAYPELSCVGPTLAPRSAWTCWGVCDEVFCAGNDETIRFLEGVLDEVCELFDSPVVHIGGDECPKTRWKACPKCQARIKALGLKDEAALQAWMTARFTTYLAKRSRRTIGWDEILEGNVPADAIVMSWRGAKGGIAAAAKGHDVVMTPYQQCYFIFSQGVRDSLVYPPWYRELVTTRDVHSFDPVAGIPLEQRRHVLGSEGCLWSEYIWNGDELMWNGFPRALALSDVLWTGAGHRNWDAFARAAEVHRDRLRRRGVNCAPVRAGLDDRSNPPVIPQPEKMSVLPGIVPLDAPLEVRTDATIPAEGYRLDVEPEGRIVIAKSDAAGEFYARQTLSQLAVSNGYRCARIEDRPAYRWRGLLIDDCRHFFGKDVVKKTVDVMARYKMNVLHWHLTDDQGWRLDVPGLPELVKYGAYRPASPVYRAKSRRTPEGEWTTDLDGQVYGPFYYTEADVREIVAYAAERHVTVVPEIDLPGHLASALAAYPEFACRPENLGKRTPRLVWGIEKDVLCVGNDQAIAFLEKVLDYVCRVFPSEVVHIGGDECPQVRWRECPKCQKRIRDEGLGDEKGLQPWVTRHFVKFLADRGKRSLGWDEYLLGPGIPTNAMAMSWRIGKQGAGHDWLSPAELAAKGHDVVMTPNTFCYLDYGQGRDDDPYYYGGGCVTLEKAHSLDPCEGVPEALRAHIVGGQGNCWSEHILNRFDLEWKTWPRACALAEVFWSGSGKPAFADFLRRMEAHRKMLLKMGVNCSPL